ncbi:MAG: DsbA family protein [Burkholderiales bacterium]|nr:DsbA family protein [Burkholderiales bacterium]
MPTLIAVILIASAALLPAHAAEPVARPAAEPDPALVDAIVRKLEADGTLDRAVERAIDRYVKRQREAQQSAQAREETELRAQAKSARPVSPRRDHIRGNPSAAVSIIEYSDFECPLLQALPRHARGAHAAVRGPGELGVSPLPARFPQSRRAPGSDRERVRGEAGRERGVLEVHRRGVRAHAVER